MRLKIAFFLIAQTLILFPFPENLSAQRIMEKLNRGAIAVVADSGQVFISWRLLANDPENTTFNIYRNDIQLTKNPIENSTSFSDEKGSVQDIYSIVPVFGGKEDKNKSDRKYRTDSFVSSLF